MALNGMILTALLAAWALAVCASGAADLAADVAVLFVDNSRGAYLQKDSAGQGAPISPLAAVASTAALLGVSLPPHVDESTSSQLADLLGSDPFSRPRAVFTAVIPGIDAGALGQRGSPLAGVDNVVLRGLATPLGAPVRTPAESALAAASLVHELSRLPSSAGEEVQLVAVGCAADQACDGACAKEELQALAEATGWSYSDEEAGSLGALSSPHHPGATLDLSQPAVLALAEEVACLLRKAQTHSREDLLLGGVAPAPTLFFASVTGLQAVQAEFGKESAESAAAASLVLDAVSQAVLRLQEAHNGRLAASVALLGSAPAVALEQLGASLGSARAVRRLQEAVETDAATEGSELVKNAVLWVTAFVLLVAVLLGVCGLLCMPLTKDTLLYTSAKLD